MSPECPSRLGVHERRGERRTTAMTSMKVFVAGATGAVGKRLVPLLVASGYDMSGMTHSIENADSIRASGAESVVADGLDRSAVIEAVARAKPEVAIHHMTGLTGVKSFKRF